MARVEWRPITWQLAADVYHMRVQWPPGWPTREGAQRRLFRRIVYILRYEWRSQVRKSSTQSRRARRTLITKRQRR